MPIGDLFQNPDNLKVQGKDDTHPQGDITQASDYINVANAINDSFTTVEVAMNEHAINLNLSEEWAVRLGTPPDESTPDLMSSKAYALSTTSLVNSIDRTPKDEYGDELVDKKNCVDMMEEYDDKLVQATVLADQAKGYVLNDAVQKSDSIESAFNESLSYLQQVSGACGYFSEGYGTGNILYFNLDGNLSDESGNHTLNFSRASGKYVWDGSVFNLIANDIPEYVEGGGIRLEPKSFNLESDVELTNGWEHITTISDPNVTYPVSQGQVTPTVFLPLDTQSSRTHTFKDYYPSVTDVYDNKPMSFSCFIRTDINESLPQDVTIRVSDGTNTSIATCNMLSNEITLDNGGDSLLNFKIEQYNNWYRIAIYQINGRVYWPTPLKYYSITLSFNNIPTDLSKPWNKLFIWCPQLEFGTKYETNTISNYWGCRSLVGPSSPLPGGMTREEDRLTLPGSVMKDVALKTTNETNVLYSIDIEHPYGGLISTVQDANCGVGATYDIIPFYVDDFSKKHFDIGINTYEQNAYRMGTPSASKSVPEINDPDESVVYPQNLTRFNILGTLKKLTVHQEV